MDSELSKTERRRAAKLKKKEAKKADQTLSERQTLRLATKEKKMAPRLSQDDRNKKFQAKILDGAREKDSAKFVLCLGCRKKGHYLKDCPEAGLRKSGYAKQICYNCGKDDHSLKCCPKPRSSYGSLKFAHCFLCEQRGHISRDCPQNANGLYPKGGCCHICFQKDHLVKDCPERTEEDKEKHRKRKADAAEAELGPCIGEMLETYDEEDAPKEGKKQKKQKKSKKIRGDDEMYIADEAEED